MRFSSKKGVRAFLEFRGPFQVGVEQKAGRVAVRKNDQRYSIMLIRGNIQVEHQSGRNIVEQHSKL